jgi:chromosome segregation ATPase
MEFPAQSPNTGPGHGDVGLRAEKELLEVKVADLEAELSHLGKSAMRYHRKAKDYRRQCKLLSSEFYAQKSELTRELDHARAQLHLTKNESDLLRAQLDAANVSQTDGKSAWKSIHSSAQEIRSSITLLTDQFDSQRSEIAKLSFERNKMGVLIQNLHFALCAYESITAEMATENKRLKARDHEQSFEALPLSHLEITNPFTGELGEKVRMALLCSQFSFDQKIQFVFSEASKLIHALEVEISDFKSKQRAAEVKTKKTAEVTSFLIGSLKALAFNESDIAAIPFTSPDSAFQHFLAQHALDFDSVRYSLDSQLIPLDRFVVNHSENAVSVVESICAVSDEASSFLQALFLVNLQLGRQVNSLIQSAETQAALQETVSALGLQSLSDVPGALRGIASNCEKLRERYEKSHSSVRQLQSALQKREMRIQKLERDLSSRVEKESELVQTITDLKQRIKSLEREAGQSARDLSNLSMQYNGVIETEVPQLKAALDKARSELIRVKRGQTEASDASAHEIENLSHVARSSSAQLESLQESYRDLLLKYRRMKSSHRRHVEDIHQRHADSLEQQQESFRALQDSLEKANNELREKVVQLTALTKRLTKSLSESERHNRVLDDELATVTSSRQTLEIRVNAAEAQIEHTRQVLQAQSTARLLALETKLVEAHNAEKSRLATETERVLSIIAGELGPVYGFRGLELDPESCRVFLRRVKADLERLRA